MTEKETKQLVRSFIFWRTKIKRFHYAIREDLTDEEWAVLKDLEPTSYEYWKAFEKIMTIRLGEIEMTKLL